MAETRGNPLALLELPRGLTPVRPGGRVRAARRAAAGRAGSRTASGGRSTPCRRRPGGCCCWRRPTRPATRRWCGGPRGGWASAPRPRRPRPRRGWPSSAPGCGSAIRWSARRSTGRRRRRTGGRRTGRWPRPPTRRPTRTAAPGTGRRPRPGPMRTSPPSWSGSAGRAQARGGLAAAAAFLERAAALTPDPARRAGRALAAAQASLQAGAFGKALELLAMAEAGPLDELQGARADWLRGQTAFASSQGSDAPPLLLKAARRLEPLDLDLARETYLDAWQAAHIRRAPGRRRRPGRGLPGRPGAAPAGAPAAPGRPPARRPGRSWSPTVRPPPPRCCARHSAPSADPDVPRSRTAAVGLDGTRRRATLCGMTKAGA